MKRNVLSKILGICTLLIVGTTTIINNEVIDEKVENVDLYSDGTTNGFSSVKPFTFTGVTKASYDAAATFHTEGYITVNGNNWGSDQLGYTGTWYRQYNAGLNIVNYDLNFMYMLVVDANGTAKVAASAKSSSNAYNTISVGGVETSETNKVQAVSIGTYNQLVLMQDGTMYTSLDGESSLDTVVFTAEETQARGGIVDMKIGMYYQFVLFADGSLYGGEDGVTSSEMNFITSNVKMFDYGIKSSYLYIYDDLGYFKTINCKVALEPEFYEFEVLLQSNDIKQIAGDMSIDVPSGAVAYLTNDNTGYFFQETHDLSTPDHVIEDVAYIDIGSNGIIGYSNLDDELYAWRTATGTSYMFQNPNPAKKRDLYPIAIEEPVAREYDTKNITSTYPTFTVYDKINNTVDLTTDRSFAFTSYINKIDYSSVYNQLNGSDVLNVTISGKPTSGSSFSNSYVYTGVMSDSNIFPQSPGTYSIYSTITNGNTIVSSNTFVYTIGNSSTTPQALLNSESLTSKFAELIYDNDNNILTTEFVAAVESGIKTGVYSYLDDEYYYTNSENSNFEKYVLSNDSILNNDSYWDIVWSTSATATTTNLTSINQKGTYYLRFKLKGLENYTSTTQWQTFEFVISTSDSTLLETELGIVLSNDVYQSTNLNEVAFGTNYYINISNSKYSSSNFIQVVNIYSNDDALLYSYNYSDNASQTSSLFNLPKSVGTYKIEVIVMSNKEVVFGHHYNVYNIVKSDIVLTENSNDKLSTYLNTKFILNEGGSINVVSVAVINDIVTQINNGLVETSLLKITTGSYNQTLSYYINSFTLNDFIISFSNSDKEEITSITSDGIYYINIQFDVSINELLVSNYSDSNVLSIAFAVGNAEIPNTDNEQGNTELPNDDTEQEQGNTELPNGDTEQENNNEQTVTPEEDTNGNTSTYVISFGIGAVVVLGLAIIFKRK